MRIASYHGKPVCGVRQTFVYWGSTGTGKSRRAFDEAGLESFWQNPRSKFSDGYRGQKNMVIDEFRGGIDIAHILRWTDRYPVNLEIKGATVPSNVTTIWITSNLHPREWYPALDEETQGALLRRLTIVHFPRLPAGF